MDVQEQQYYLHALNNIEDFKDNKNWSEEKVIRLQKWYQINGSYFCPKWKVKYKRWVSHPYPDFLLQLQSDIQDHLQSIQMRCNELNIPEINSCLINKYRNGNDYIRPHRDTDMSFGKEPTVLGLSLGCDREIKFCRVKYNGHNTSNSKIDKEKSDLNFTQTLKSGSLFIMAGSSQKYFTHEIPKSTKNQIRYSLTFREFVV